MKTFRATRPKEQKQLRNPYDIKYEIKENDKNKAATVIQKQYKRNKTQNQKREQATAAEKDVFDDIL